MKIFPLPHDLGTRLEFFNIILNITFNTTLNHFLHTLSSSCKDVKLSLFMHIIADLWR